MLEKARREHARLKGGLCIDHVFNFFVTATHIQDYVRRTTQVPASDLDAFLKDPDIADCRDMCDKAKHAELTKRPDPLTGMIDCSMGGSAMGELPMGGGAEWCIHTPTRRVELMWLADVVLSKWEAFFARHGI